MERYVAQWTGRERGLRKTTPVGGVASVGGATGPFIVGGAVFLLGALAVAIRGRANPSAAQESTARAG